MIDGDTIGLVLPQCSAMRSTALSLITHPASKAFKYSSKQNSVKKEGSQRRLGDVEKQHSRQATVKLMVGLGK